ncbi:hypothetical protein N7532_011900 [Penicillium argentinense]|uniref:SprT-like domain-containing protein n=1 Tax=Penicillium argentinense TaxID=1131581 RepID=A0A9W9EJC0_9EURO|nr:uncharacterized protein N7532_011900 [Penicillium argentinense]KAJ5082857.1 hypothetical protein N7532_011900 [Penicillium argentinense]
MGSGLSFDIFPDEGENKSEEGIQQRRDTLSSSPTKQKQKRSLKTSQVNSLLLPTQQRPRQRPSSKIEQDDYDKENDITGDATEPYTPERSPGHRPPLRQNNARTPARRREVQRARSRTGSQSTNQDSSDENGFDSLDEFVVSDNEEISYHETSDSEPENDKAPTPPPPKSARRRLIRGRKPNADTDLPFRKSSSPKTSPILALKQSHVQSPAKSMKTTKNLFQDDFELSKKLRTLILEDGDNGSAPELVKKTTEYVILRTHPCQGTCPLTRDHSFVIEPNSPPSAMNTIDSVFQTPPSTPSRGRQLSPGRQKNRIPPTPYKEDVDAFWDQEKTNNWIDRHSPHKNPATGLPIIDLLRDFDDSDTEKTSRGSTPSTEQESTPAATTKPPKTPSKTALKKAEAEKNKAAKARRLSFDNKKADFAQTFLTVLDNAVSGGKVGQIAESTGGVKITWSKTLQKTAGRASWKGERIRDANGRTINIKHHASIELAERIIDDEYRLINTLAHEYCHLANYMVSNVHDQPHGASFKQWGLQCTEALRDHPIYGGKINVTTKHSYKIDYKYVWACVGCGQTYGRHSKSIDPTRSRCGDRACGGGLEQIKPKPRNVSPKKGTTPAAQRKAMENVSKELGGFTL